MADLGETWAKVVNEFEAAASRPTEVHSYDNQIDCPGTSFLRAQARFSCFHATASRSSVVGTEPRHLPDAVRESNQLRKTVNYSFWFVALLPMSILPQPTLIVFTWRHGSVACMANLGG